MVLSVFPAALFAMEDGYQDEPDGSAELIAEWLDYLEKNPTEKQTADNETEENESTSTKVQMDSKNDTEENSTFAAKSLQTLASKAGVKRYTVLVLDRSGSMGGNPMTSLKKAAVNFCDSVLKADGENYIAVVTYGSASTVLSDFTKDISALKNSINGITATGSTNTNAGFVSADGLLEKIPDDKDTIKNIILMSDGMPNAGTTASTGKYTYKDYSSYTYANAVYNTAASVKTKKTFIYTLGFFHGLTGASLDFARRFMRDLQNAGYYDVVNPDDLEFIFGDIANDIINKNTGTFNFPSAATRDFSAEYFYDDEYFSKNASIYNPSLATMSLCFELSAWGSNVDGTKDYTNKSRNAKDLLKQIGFKESDIEVNDFFKQKPSEDSMGVVISHKDIEISGKKYTLLALATRGGGYEAEWAGNFTIGSTGQHEGFKTASDEAYRFLSAYINKHKADFQKDVKFWFAGYSRGGATVNLLAGRLNNEKQIAGINVNKEDLYAYCFEPPMGVQKSETLPESNYSNIHNIVNPNDPVPKVAPKYKNWDFARYGKDEPVIPSKLTSSNSSNFDEMLDKFKALNTDWSNESIVKVNGKDTHIIDTFQAKKIDPSVKVNYDGHWEERTGILGIKYYVWVSNFDIDAKLVANDNKEMSVFLDNLILSLSKGLGNRKRYEEKLQDAARLAAAEFMGGGYESYKWDKVPDIFSAKLDAHILDIAYTFVFSGMSGVEDIITEYLFESIKEAGIDIKAYGSVPGALGEALKVVVKTVIESIKISGGDDLVTLAENVKKLFPAHYPELCLAWLQMQDVNYTPQGRQLFIIDCYRIVRINCPVDVEAYDSGGKLIAQIKNNVPQEISGSTIFASYNSDGEKLIYLPADEAYKLKIKGTADGKLNYSVNEYSYSSSNFAKIVNFNDISFVNGDEFEALIPKFETNDTLNTGEGSSVKYTLAKNSVALNSNKELNGTDAENAVYTVYTESDNSEGGSTLGGGIYTEGAFAAVKAIAFEKCEFLGWFENDVLVSKEYVYRFKVEKDVNLVAKFKGTRPNPTSGTYDLTITASKGGTIKKGANGKYSEGSRTPLIAVPDSGYKFKNWTSSNGGKFENANSADTIFTMPANECKITANFEYIGGSSNNNGNTNNNNNSNNNGSSSSSSNSSSSNSSGSTSTSSDIIVKVNKNNVKSKDEKIATGKRAYTVTNPNNNDSETEYIISKKDFNTIESSDRQLMLISGKTSINLSNSVLSEIKKEANGDVVIKIAVADKNRLSDAQKKAVGNRPVYEISISSDGKDISQLKGNVEITLPYDIALSEKANCIVIFNLNDSGNLAEVKNSFYDSSSRSVKFITNHLSFYVISHNQISFADINGHWGQNVIEQAATRKMVYGVGEGLYQPNRSITRAEFVQMIYNVLELTKPSALGIPYQDVASNTWYYNAVLSAKNAGLLTKLKLNGDKFMPNQTITREEMAVILANAISYRKISESNTISIKEKFTDYNKMDSDYRDLIEKVVRGGLMTGTSDSTFEPTAATTRAQAAQVQMNLVKVMGILD